MRRWKKDAWENEGGIYVHRILRRKRNCSNIRHGNGPGVANTVWIAGKHDTLSDENGSSMDAQNVSVRFTNLPSWLDFKSGSVMLKSIPAKSTGDAEFTFSVDKKAPVGKDTTLTAAISSIDGQMWTKDITVSVGAPKDYKLYNNFPNPFNPSTKIAFELPKASHVTLTIYDVLGREVAENADQKYPAGYNEVTWNGLNRSGEQASSGVYFYRITAGHWSKVMKMLR